MLGARRGILAYSSEGPLCTLRTVLRGVFDSRAGVIFSEMGGRDRIW